LKEISQEACRALFAEQANCLRSLRDPLDFIQRRRVLQGGCITEFFAQVRGADDPAHHFCVPCLWYVTYEKYVARSKRFARLDGERVF
jgi:hypothetical protein